MEFKFQCLEIKFYWNTDMLTHFLLFFYGIFVLLIYVSSFYFLNLFLFIYFWLRWAFVATHGLSLVAVSGGYSSLWCVGFSLRWLLLLRSTGSRHTGFSSCGTRAQ